MNLGQRFLKMLSPKDEEARMRLRLAMSHAQANSEDLRRTTVADAGAIQEAIERYKREKEAA